MFFLKLNLPCTRTKYSLSSSPAGLDAKQVYLPVSSTWKHRNNFSRNSRLWEKFRKTKKYKHGNKHTTGSTRTQAQETQNAWKESNEVVEYFFISLWWSYSEMAQELQDSIKSFMILCASTKDGTGYRDGLTTEEILLCTVINIFLVSPSHKLLIVQPRSVCFKNKQQPIPGPIPLLSEELHLGIHSWIQP